MRIITEQNVDQLLSLTKGEDIAKLSFDKFQNFEQVKIPLKKNNFQIKVLLLLKKNPYT